MSVALMGILRAGEVVPGRSHSHLSWDAAQMGTEMLHSLCILPGQAVAGRRWSDGCSMHGWEEREVELQSSLLTAPSIQSCKFWHQHC